MERLKNSLGFGGDLAAFFEHIKTSPKLVYPDTEEGRSTYLRETSRVMDAMYRDLGNSFGRLPKVGCVSRSDVREHPQKHLARFSGIVQADCYNGFEPLFDPKKKALPIMPAFCLAHARRKFFELADIAKNAREGKKGKPISPIALEAVRRLDALFVIEREINGLTAAERLSVRQQKSKPLFDRTRHTLALLRGSRADRLHAQALGRLRPLP